MLGRKVFGLAWLAVLGAAQNVSTERYLSVRTSIRAWQEDGADARQRRDIVAPALSVQTIDRSTVSPGYIFLAPKARSEHDFTQSMYIYNNGGGLVWSGHALNVAELALWNFEPCTFEGAASLCAVAFRSPDVWEQERPEWDVSHAFILDRSYRRRRTITPNSVGGRKPFDVDFHEFRIVGDGSTALMTTNSARYLPRNVSHCRNSSRAPIIKVGHFIEVKTDGSNETVFQWNSLDHVDIEETSVCPGDAMVGSGTSQRHGFDYFHINSVDKNSDGDYLVSGRFTSTIYKIAGLTSPSGLAPGEIIWRLGGKQNSFEMTTDLVAGGDFNFTYQHDARFHDDGSITLWDNAMKEKGQPSAMSSSAKQVVIDEAKRTARLVWQGTAPSRDLDESQGNHQLLANGNHFCGMGSTPEIFERTGSGAVSFAASFGVEPMQSYRAFHSPWVGDPAASELALFGFARSCTGYTTLYASWNGATEVRSYRFMGANSSTSGLRELATVATDDGFETVARIADFVQYSYAEALGGDGTPLGRTPTVRTFVPATHWAEQCTDERCDYELNYDIAEQAHCIIEDKYESW